VKNHKYINCCSFETAMEATFDVLRPVTMKITNATAVAGLLHRVDVGEVANLPEEHAASIFLVGVCRLLSSSSHTNKQTPWSESESELYRPSDRRFSAK
jgi:hypothetical protein